MLRQKHFFIALLCALSPFTSANDDTPQLSLPLVCTLGSNCFIQNYVDIDPSLAYSDYHCGFLSYDAHRGTDFRPKTFDVLASDIPVFAAHDGQIRAIRDGMDDVSVRLIGKDAIKNREAGNSVVLVYNKNWESQYAHLKKGSIKVKTGQLIKRGELLGFVGLSGNTEFGHLHFEIRFQGKPIDPFIGIDGNHSCQLGNKPLWTNEALAQLNYLTTDILAAGFSDHALLANEIITENNRLNTNAPALVFWATLLGVQKGDEQIIKIYAPDNNLLFENSNIIDHNMAQHRGFFGVKPKTKTWAKGEYRVDLTLSRLNQNEPVLSKTFLLQIE